MPNLVKDGQGVIIGPNNKIVIPSSVDVYDELGQLVGWIQKLDMSNSREITKVRHLSSGDAGRIIEQIPQPEDFQVTVDGFHLYNSTNLTGEIPHYSLPARLSMGTGANGGFGGQYLFLSLNSQGVPFNLRIVETHPTTKAESEFWYKGCMLTSWSYGYNIGDVSVSDSCSISVARIAPSFEESESEQGIIVGNY